MKSDNAVFQNWLKVNKKKSSPKTYGEVTLVYGRKRKRK